MKVNQTGDDLEKNKEFKLFCRINNKKLIDKNYVCGDIKISCDFLFQFVIKEFVDPRGLFKRLCSQKPLEFLILFDFYREYKNKNMLFKVLMCQCFAGKFHFEGNKYIKNLFTFTADAKIIL